MSQAIVFGCDRCGTSGTEEDARGWVSIEMARLGTVVVTGHVCGACVAPLADFFAKIPRSTIGDAFATHESVLDMTSAPHGRDSVRVLPKQSAQITSRVQRPFKPNRLIIERATEWLVNDIRIGVRSQFSQAGDVPGDLFAEDAKIGPIEFETVHCAMDVSIIATYIGKNPEGAIFTARFVGREQGFAPVLKECA